MVKTWEDIKTIGELRQFLKEINADWMPEENVPDDEEIKPVSFGGNKDNPELVREVEKLELTKILLDLPSNPFLIERWKDHGIEIPEQESLEVIDPVSLRPIDVKKAISSELEGSTEDKNSR